MLPRKNASAKKYLKALFYYSVFAQGLPLSAATFTVTNTGNAGPGTLRQAIIDSNTAGGTNTIVFSGLSGSVSIGLGSSLPPILSTSVFPAVPINTTIDVGNLSLSILGNSLFQPFFVSLGNTFKILGSAGGTLTVNSGASKGGAGGTGAPGGGGGAMGAGGGLYVASGSNVTVQGVLFNACTAVGGAGGSRIGTGGGGGGGGMSGGTGGRSQSGSGGGGGGYGGAGGAGASTASAGGGGGGGGMGAAGGIGFVNGGGGGGGSDLNPGNPGTATQGGNGGQGNPPGTFGAGGTTGDGSAGTLTSGGGGGGIAASGTPGNGGSSPYGGGGGGGFNESSGGGLGGASNSFGGGGGGGSSTPSLQNGGAGGNAGSYAGGGGNGLNTPTIAGGGGFGGGGGGAGSSGSGGLSIFGGGGGGGSTAPGSGGPSQHGFGGNGSDNGFGGGGAGLGGGIFVEYGGTLTVQDPVSFTNFTTNSVQGGVGGGFGALNGQALGPEIFLMSTGLINFNFTNPATTLTLDLNINSDYQDPVASPDPTKGLAMIGVGTLVLGGTNTYTGSTTINNGTVQISSDSNLGVSANPVNFGGGTLEITSTLISARTINLTGSGAIQTDADTEWLGQITGAGTLIKSGSAVLALGNTSNNYSGGTLFAGGTVQVSQASELGSGGLEFNGGTLEVTAGSTPPVTFGMPILIDAADGTIVSDVDTIFSGTITSATNGRLSLVPVTSSTTIELAGVISGSAGLNAIGPGTVIIDQINSFTGGIAFEGGFVRISAPGNLGTGVLDFEGGTLELSSTFSGPLISNPFQLNIGGTIQSDVGAGPATFSGNMVFPSSASSFTFNTGASTFITLSGNISGPGSLVKDGAGTLILSGTNTYTGTTSISQGTLQIDSNAGLPSTTTVLDFGSLVFNNTGDAFLSGSILGSGSLSVQNTGTVHLSGTNTYLGGTFISNGTLSIEGPFALSPSNVTVNFPGNLAFASPQSLTVPQLITGTGTVTQNGPGTVTLTNNNNTYSGGTFLNSGILKVASDSPLGLFTGGLTFNGGTLEITAPYVTFRSVTLNAGGGTIQVDNTRTEVVPALFITGFTGTGPLTTQGSGIVELLGFNTYTGATTVKSGTLQVTGSLNNSSLVTVQLGTLSVDGTVLSPITVDFGGTLTGGGTVGDVNLNGIVAPGHGVGGTLHAANFTFNNGSTYFDQINNTTSDLIAATGTVTINPGSTLRLIPTNFTNPTVTSYTIITAGSVVENAPFTLVNPLTRYQFSVVYDPTDVKLVLTGVTPFPDIVPSGNAHVVAKCYDKLVPLDLHDLAGITAILDLQTPSEMSHSFNQMQPADFNNIAFAQENVAELMRQIYSVHFYEQRVAPCPEEYGFRLWAAPFIESANQSGHGLLHGYQEEFSGFTAALDYNWKKHWMLTGGFTYAAADMNVVHTRTSADFKTYAGSVATCWTDTHWFADALLAYLYSPIHAKRKMHFTANLFGEPLEQNRTASHSDHSNQGLAHLGGGYDFKKKVNDRSTYNFYPFANIDYQYLWQTKYKEHGAGSLDLKVRGKSYDYLRSEIGVGVGYVGCFKHSQVMFDVTASYVNESRFKGKETKAQFKPISCTMDVTGLKPINNLFSPTARVRITSPVNGFSFAIGYVGEYGEHFILNAGEAELRKAF